MAFSGVLANLGRATALTASSQQEPENLEDISFYTFTYGPDINYSRCVQSVNAVDHERGSLVVGNEPGRANLGLLRSTPDLGVVVAGFGKGFMDLPFSDPSMLSVGQDRKNSREIFGSLYVLRREGAALDQWDISTTVIGSVFDHGIEILPDGDTLLVSTTGMDQEMVRVPPFRIEKHRLSDVTRIPDSEDRPGTHKLGSPVDTLELPNPTVNMLLDPTRNVVHALTRERYHWRELMATTVMSIHTFDATQMTEVDSPIDIAQWQGWATDLLIPMMASSPDGRFMVTTRGPTSSLNVIDLLQRKSWTINVEDASSVLDVAFSGGIENSGLLALNVRSGVSGADRPEDKPWATFKSQVRVGELSESGFHERGRGPWVYGNIPDAPAALEWTESGASIVAALDHKRSAVPEPASEPMAAVFSVRDEGRSIEQENALFPCRESAFVMDVLTKKGRLPTATNTSTATRTTAPTITPTSTATDTPTSTATPTPTSTTHPRPVYLPILLRENCTPQQKRQDVVLIIDTSSSMKEPSRSGRRKIEAAQDAALRYLDLLRLDDGDRAAVVSFDVAARTHVSLTADRASLVSAITQLRVGEKTCLPCAVQQGAEELAGHKRRVGFTLVIILLTDGRSNPRPVSEAVEEAIRAKDTGIIVFTVGLGNDIEREALRQIASKPHYFYHAPEAEDLSAIYESIAIEVPCSRELFWGRR